MSREHWALIAALSIGVSLTLGCDEVIVSLLPPSGNSSEADAEGPDTSKRGLDAASTDASGLEAVADRFGASSEAAVDDGGDATSVAAVSAARYLGCFGDEANPTSLHLAYDDPTNTAERCLLACTMAGYLYAATRAKNECYCANSYGGQGPSTNCDLPCGGNVSETCGGTNASSVYYTSVPPPPLQHLGCFADSVTRDLPYRAYDSQRNTVETCVAACTYHGYLYAGTQYFTQCYCGDTYGGQGTASHCDTPCGGNPSETCGGAYCNSVYRTTVSQDAGRD
ncbi:MAG TPA: WSC domain-containing protein [Polyangiaceae bacterium]|nr:WSC domain-containing protein [Polyangiaceae bacterium]